MLKFISGQKSSNLLRAYRTKDELNPLFLPNNVVYVTFMTTSNDNITYNEVIDDCWGYKFAVIPLSKFHPILLKWNLILNILLSITNNININNIINELSNSLIKYLTKGGVPNKLDCIPKLITLINKYNYIDKGNVIKLLDSNGYSEKIFKYYYNTLIRGKLAQYPNFQYYCLYSSALCLKTNTISSFPDIIKERDFFSTSIFNKITNEDELKESLNNLYSLLCSFTNNSDIKPSIFLNAWFYGNITNKVIETSHPYKGESFSGYFYLEEEATLTFDNRCVIPEGYKLKLISDKINICLSSEIDLLDDKQFKLNNFLEYNLYKVDESVKIKEDCDIYGISFIVSYNYDIQKKYKTFNNFKDDILKDYIDMNKNWDINIDYDIISCLDNLSIKKLETFDVVNSFLLSKEDYLYKFQRLNSIPLRKIYTRLRILYIYNLLLFDNVRFLPVDKKENNGSLISMIYNSKSLVLKCIKQVICLYYIHISRISGSTLNITLNNMIALESQEKQIDNLNNSNCIFMQFVNIFRRKNYKCFHNQDQPIHVSYQHENGIDQGGLYRDSLTQAVEDIFSNYFPLFILCPNAKSNTMENIDKYIPNPEYNTKEYSELYYFVGILLGVSCRYKLTLPFSFPSIIWKHLGDIKKDINDLRGYDSIYATYLQDLLNSTKDEFYERYDNLTFVTPLSSGKTISLITNGENISVTYENRQEFVKLSLENRLNEFNQSLDEMKNGLYEIIPKISFELFTEEDIEYQICGDPIIDIEELKRNTEYSGYTSTSDTIGYFWDVLENLSNEEKSNFIRFVSGRSRLPTKWNVKFVISIGYSLQIPMSHTCSFTIELPQYDSYNKMRNGLLKCIHYGLGGILNS